jgi:HlyD family secretion protein
MVKSMENKIKLQTVTGAAMDKVVPRNRKKLYIKIGIAAILVSSVAAVAWYYMPKGLQVASSDLRVQAVEQGVFLDDLIVRANAQPLNSVILDSVEYGRVEEIFIQDGALVKKGQLLFRLSNPQRNLDLLQRKGEHTQQISNLANMRVGFQAAVSDHQRRLSSLEFEFGQQQKKYARDQKLAAQGFISNVALEESKDALDRRQFALDEEKHSQDVEAKVRSAAMAQMETGIDGLQTGLKLVNSTVEALAVRSPIDGKLTDFHLQVGESVTTGKRIGRIDDPKLFKLSAQVDEFYLNRVSIGHRGMARMNDKTYAVEVLMVFPQIKEGRFLVELKFVNEQPEKLNPGQSLDTTITLGDPSPATLLPMGPFINDTGGVWVFVVSKDGRTAERRAIKVGHRSNRQVEIISGLIPGEKVLVSSYAQFLNVQRLQIATK